MSDSLSVARCRFSLNLSRALSMALPHWRGAPRRLASSGFTLLKDDRGELTNAEV